MGEDVYIAATVRTAVGKAPKGTLATTRPDDLAAVAIRGALERLPGLEAHEIEDVILGCAMPEAEQGTNVARIASLRAGLPVEVSAMTINRFCSSGLQAIALAADSIRSGRAEAALAGGTESMSMIPGAGNKFSANPWLVEHHAEAYLSMGLTAENVARKYGISREDADAFALRSHQRALAAIEAGKFDEEIVPVTVTNVSPAANPAKPEIKTTIFARDEGPRADTSAEALAKLKPVFHAKGTVTAGNSSQTSDGAAAAIVISEKLAKARGIPVLARFVSFATAGCAPEEMGIGPVYAIPKALRLAGLKLEDIDLIELNEAFAAQSLAVIRQAGIDPEKVNVNGGAVALGHPLGCTGAKLTASLIYEMKRRGARYGLVTMCVGGGMGAAGVIENVN
ncbi:acetyl-CoA C-acyltransferase [Silvibacterium dinghuense]|uniref:acetyl-CoA C-acyltransferase n=1 Tax=Silvibacterium dinghuense TaxID=1560006 RepID=A0A4V1NVP5_9BACT|nr:acetyl-CoA C-acyltransferase [Silvibacterium dinghuense]RXS96642.1 acetyl-CoA C-acyltransferase [Silvibacterium dinghuense]GGG92474.1 acetyl-CoA acetyltransferase [Silvibacterium dinghuense]